jgi:hypothetical protein
MPLRSARALGRTTSSSIPEPALSILTCFGEDVVHGENYGITAGFAFGQGLVQGHDFLFMLFKQAHGCPDDFAFGLEATAIDLLGDEALKVLSQGNAGNE